MMNGITQLGEKMMCLILFALDEHPDYKLVLAANRDEFYARPSSRAAFWKDEPSLLAGKDLLFSGTWLGMTTAGRFSALTNFRRPSAVKKDMPSRGKLVYNYLHSGLNAEGYVRQLLAGGKNYNGYNLLLGTQDAFFYYTNFSEEPVVRIEKGIHGLSNSFLDVPWPKVRRGTKRLADALRNDNVDVPELFELMSDCEPVRDCELPHTGVSLAEERMLSPIFVKSPDFGTCVSTVLLIDRSNRVRFCERTFEPGGEAIAGEVRYEFRIRQP